MSINFSLLGFHEPFDAHVNLHGAEEDVKKHEMLKESADREEAFRNHDKIEERKEAIRKGWDKEAAARENALGRDLKPIVERDITPRYQAPVAQKADAVHKAHQDAVDRNNRRYNK